MSRKAVITVTADAVMSPAIRAVAATVGAGAADVIVAALAVRLSADPAGVATAISTMTVEQASVVIRGCAAVASSKARAKPGTARHSSAKPPDVSGEVNGSDLRRDSALLGTARHSSAKPKQSPPVKVEKPARPRDLVFDAVAEVCGADVSIRSKATLVAKVASVLKKAAVPYTPEEIHDFGDRFWQLCPWAADNRRDRPTPGELENHIDKVRADPVARAVAVPVGRQTAAERSAGTVSDTLRLLEGIHAQRPNPTTGGSLPDQYPGGGPVPPAVGMARAAGAVANDLPQLPALPAAAGGAAGGVAGVRGV